MADKKTSIGGQALIEGIMMRGPEKTAMAVRNAAGNIILEKWQTDTKTPKLFKLPIIRGIYGMISSFTLGYKCLMRSADISLADAEEADKAVLTQNTADGAVTDASDKDEANEATSGTDTPSEKADDSECCNAVSADAPCEPAKAGAADKAAPEKKESTTENKLVLGIVMVVGIVLGIALSVFLFVFLPSLISKLIFGGDTSKLSGTEAICRSAIEGIIKIILLVGYMWVVSFMKDIRRTFMYHGAEHKTIFCYEKGLPLTVENIRKQRRFHPRCGTSFLILMLLVGIIIGMFIRFDNVFIRSLIKILLLPFTVGIGYELIKFAGRHDNALTRIISAPGVWLQHITTKEPDDSMIECAIKAMNEVIPSDSEKDNW